MKPTLYKIAQAASFILSNRLIKQAKGWETFANPQIQMQKKREASGLDSFGYRKFMGMVSRARTVDDLKALEQQGRGLLGEMPNADAQFTYGLNSAVKKVNRRSGTNYSMNGSSINYGTPQVSTVPTQTRSVVRSRAPVSNTQVAPVTSNTLVVNPAQTNRNVVNRGIQQKNPRSVQVNVTETPNGYEVGYNGMSAPGTLGFMDFSDPALKKRVMTGDTYSGVGMTWNPKTNSYSFSGEGKNKLYYQRAMELERRRLQDTFKKLRGQDINKWRAAIPYYQKRMASLYSMQNPLGNKVVPVKQTPFYNLD